MKPILEVKNLTHVYSKGTPFEHTAIQDANFVLYPGEFVGVIGHTGSGKSTLIQHMNGLLNPSQGDVLFKGKSIWSEKTFTRDCRFHIGLVFQYPEYQLFEETVYQDIAFGPGNMGLKEEEIRRRVLEAAGFVGITQEQLEKSPFDLSGGQKRRVAIAGVIAMEPEILILDEPTAGLDPAGRAEILENIEAYRRAKGATVVMVSHSMEDVARLSDRMLVLNRGTIAMSGAPAEVFRQADRLLEMGLDIPQVTRVLLRLRELGVAVDPACYTVEQAVAALKEVAFHA